eukprot:c9336_g1_i4.p1 GENE.c9336_g1_i4~~c9336_g1_i4.p1  ORF type:complete len:360 (-),score=69.55 c9336_g1_i4:278-1357(-)
MPVSKDFNDVVAVDVAFFEGNDFLKIIDLSTRFMQAAWIPSKTSKVIAEVIEDKWISYFGFMSRILCDPGTENVSEEFQQFCEARGIELMTTAAQAPHSNGIVERHGGVLKETLKRLVAAHPRESRHILLAKSVMAHNCLANVDGHSPCQRAFGVNPRLGSLLDATPTMTNEFGDKGHISRLRAIEDARKAFVEAEASKAIRTAMHSARQRTPQTHTFEIDQKVYFHDHDKVKGPGTFSETGDVAEVPERNELRVDNHVPERVTTSDSSDVDDAGTMLTSQLPEAPRDQQQNSTENTQNDILQDETHQQDNSPPDFEDTPFEPEQPTTHKGKSHKKELNSSLGAFGVPPGKAERTSPIR